VAEIGKNLLDYRTVAPDRAIYIHCPRCAGSLRHEHDASNARIRPVCESCGWTYYPTNPIGALVVVEFGSGIVLVHPPTGSPEAPASLPGGLVEYAETPEAAAIRLAHEQTGLEVEVVEELARFLQQGTPFGPVLNFGFVARAVGGKLRMDGDEGPAVGYSLENMPAIIPIRAANQRVLDSYVAKRP
jgi:ADP-ribose pyrophosphatase YjhB (NUDIX family)